MGGYVFKPIVCNKSGVPDLIACYKGRFLAYECKVQGNKPTPLQDYNITIIILAGGISRVINEENYKTTILKDLESIDNNPKGSL